VGALTVVAYVIYVGAAVLMVFAILLQEGKGGGLSALGGTQAESAFGATNPIRRMTVVLAIVFFLLAGFLSAYIGARKKSVMSREEPPAAEAEEEGEGESGDGGENAQEEGSSADAPAEAGADGGEGGAPAPGPVANPVAAPGAAPAPEAPAATEPAAVE
jgi:protein translocase SecG subunit